MLNKIAIQKTVRLLLKIIGIFIIVALLSSFLLALGLAIKNTQKNDSGTYYCYQKNALHETELGDTYTCNYRQAFISNFIGAFVIFFLTILMAPIFFPIIYLYALIHKITTLSTIITIMLILISIITIAIIWFIYKKFDKKHIHFIGICGVGMSALAILWQKKGWKVTGSDVGFYPPISTHLTKHYVAYYPGWHPENIGKCHSRAGGNPENDSLDPRLHGDDKIEICTKKPDLVVVGNVAGSENPELKYVLENNIPHVSYPELIAQNLIKKKSIVCAGTYGKTTTAALLAYILKEANLSPAYMFGGLANSLELSADDLGGDYSVIEGDEYKTCRDDLRAKFFSYKPTHLLLTAVNWDHADVYHTEQSYLEAFAKLAAMIPANGLIVACADNANVKNIISKAIAPIITYSKNNGNYIFNNITQTKAGLNFTIENIGEVFEINSPMLGEYMAENICGAFVMAKEIGAEPKKIIAAIAKFNGIKRRLEKRGQTKNKTDVYDDIAHSPAKAQSVLTTLRKIYQGKIYAIFEPNTGNRQKESRPFYDHAFTDADEIIIPRLTKVKTPGSIEGEELTKIIAETHPNVKYFEKDEELVMYLTAIPTANDVIVFMGSHSFRGMIEQIVV